MKGIFAALGEAKDKGASSDVEEAPESEPAEKTGYRSLMKEAAADGDWDAFADAVVGLIKQSK